MNKPLSLAGCTKVAEADFPTEFGVFRIYGFRRPAGDGREEAVVLKWATWRRARRRWCASTPSASPATCSTACAAIAARNWRSRSTASPQEGRGLLIYEHQEGRGIGLLNKLRAYELQDQGADTVEANERLGFDTDLRSYELPGAILRYFGLKAVRLLSNNPEKVEAVENAGVQVVERVPCLADVLDTREAYLRTKKEKMGHLLEFDDL